MNSGIFYVLSCEYFSRVHQMRWKGMKIPHDARFGGKTPFFRKEGLGTPHLRENQLSPPCSRERARKDWRRWWGFYA